MMAELDQELSAPQKRAAELIAAGLPFSKVAEKVGVDRRSIYNWRQLPQFQVYLWQLARERWGELHNILLNEALRRAKQGDLGDASLVRLLELTGKYFAENDLPGGNHEDEEQRRERVKRELQQQYRAKRG